MHILSVFFTHNFTQKKSYAYMNAKRKCEKNNGNSMSLHLSTNIGEMFSTCVFAYNKN